MIKQYKNKAVLADGYSIKDCHYIDKHGKRVLCCDKCGKAVVDHNEPCALNSTMDKVTQLNEPQVYGKARYK